jgi:hypothetical protein
MGSVKKVSFRSFQVAFFGIIESRTFGEPLGSDTKKESPACKELRRSGLLVALTSDEFCVLVYRLSRECRRLEAERIKLHQVTGRMRPAIHRYQSAIGRLENCVQQLSEFEEKYGALVEHQVIQKISSAVSLIHAVASELDRRTKTLISNVHAEHRKDKDEPSRWELLFKFYEYNLKQLGVKATDQWFWCSVNNALLELAKDHKGGSMSAMTRFKLIAAISDAAGLGKVPPTTIKQFFMDSSQ